MDTAKTTRILAIESSCDETAAAVLSVPAKARSPRALPEPRTLSSVVKSQIKLHSKFGGVVPEAAARAHLKNILPVVRKALDDGGLSLEDIDYIAVTVGPGLIPSLLVGTEFAKALALAAGKPIIPVNHMLGHLYSPFAAVKDQGLRIKDIFPMASLIVSGGHTMLVVMRGAGNYRVIGQTVDDAAGEAFDKVAKLLRLPYPGGPEVSRLAEQGNPQAINFPRPMIHSKDYNFSFAGLKTAVLYYLRDSGLKTTNYKLQTDLSASFQQAAIDVLVAKTMRAAGEFKAKSVSLSGGVSANRLLRETLAGECARQGIRFFVPAMALSTDNAEMIGLAAAFMLHNGFKPKTDPAKIQADPALSL